MDKPSTFCILAVVSLIWTIPLQVCQSSQPSLYAGCYHDSNGKYGKEIEIKENTGTDCIRSCKAAGYRFAGTRLKACKCNETFTSNQADDAECVCPCPGKNSERCGGNNRISVYDTIPKLVKCVEDPHGMDFVTGEKTLEKRTFQNNSVSLCTTFCKDLSYIFAATINKFCICGDHLKKEEILPSGDCNRTCPGDHKELCGGKNSVALYQTGLIDEKTVVTQNSTRQKTSYSTEACSTSTFVAENVTSDTGNTEDTTKVTTYICVTLSVVFGAVIITGIIILFKRRYFGRKPMVKLPENPSTQDRNNLNSETDFESNNMFENSEKDCVRQVNASCAVVGHDRRTVEAAGEQYSEVIVEHSGHTLENTSQYRHIKAPQTDRMNTCAIYSHLNATKPVLNTHSTTNICSHIGGCPSQGQTDDQNSVYDKAVVSRKQPIRSDIDEYSHLNTVATKPSGTGSGRITEDTRPNMEDNREEGSSKQPKETENQYFILEPRTEDNVAMYSKEQT